jgi:diguanylate cyclase
MTNDSQRTAASSVAATGTPPFGSSSLAVRSTCGLAKGSAASSAPGNGAMTPGRAWPPSLSHEAPGDPLHRRLSDENRRLAERLRDLEGELAALRRALQRATSDALTDPLTGLANRRAFDAALEASAAAKGVRAAPAQLLVADIDKFKQLNDAHGHHFGDSVLRIAGELLAANVRRDSTVARLGGDEFALLLPGRSEPDPTGPCTRAIAERLCARIAKRPLTVRGQPVRFERITLSIGVAAWRPGDDPAGWLRRADGALYAAKRQGRNRVVVAATDVG